MSYMIFEDIAEMAGRFVHEADPKLLSQLLEQYNKHGTVRPSKDIAALHMGLGLATRNALRRLFSRRWTDIEYDDRWHSVGDEACRIMIEQHED